MVLPESGNNTPPPSVTVELASSANMDVGDVFSNMDRDMKMEMLYNTSMANEKTLDILMNNTDQFFLIVIGIIIFFMQCGFAFLEAGSIR